ncbi:MAG TPA: hypothetical protein DCG63_03805 [Methylophilaceae bacterium]|nr:hypothetical protein [Methylophilaceae bacterium]
MQRSLDDVVIGSAVKISVSIFNDLDVLTDPSALRLKVRSPAGVVTVYVFGAAAEIVKDSVGNYHGNIVLSAAGTWTYRWEADTPNAGVGEGKVLVKKSIVI